MKKVYTILFLIFISIIVKGQCPSAGNDTSLCGLTVQLNSAGVSGNWTGPAGAIYTPSSSDPHAIVTIPTFSTAFQYVDFTWNETGCLFVSDMVGVTFYRPDFAEAGLTRSVCGYSAQLSADTLFSSMISGFWSCNIPGITITYSGLDPLPWNPVVDASAVSGLFVNNQLSAFFYWQGINQFGCTSIDSVLITFNKIPVANAGSDSSVCGLFANMNATMADTTFLGTWSMLASAPAGNTEFSLPNNITTYFFVNQPGQYSYKWTVVNLANSSCLDVDTVLFNFKTFPHAIAGIDQSICGTTTSVAADTLGSHIVSAFWSSNVPGVSITYSGTDALPWNPLVDATSVSNFFVNSTRSVYLYWNGMNQQGCSWVDSLLINFYEVPTANAGTDNIICALSDTLTGVSSISNYNGIWSVLSSPSSSVITFEQNNLPNSAVSVSLSGSYSFEWTEMNTENNLCVDKDTVVFSFNTVSFVEAGLAQEICGITAMLYADTLGSNASSANWTCNVAGVNITYSGTDPIPWNPTVDVSAVSNFFINGQRQVVFYWTVQSPSGCQEMDSTSITFYENPIADAGVDTSYCSLNATMTGSWTNPVNVGLWSTLLTPTTGNAVIIATGQPNTDISVTMGGLYQFIWTETNPVNSLCIDKDTVSINYINPPNADAGIHQTVCGTAAQLFADSISSYIDSAYWTCSVPGVTITYTGSDSIPWSPLVDASLVPNFFINSQRTVSFYWNTFGQGGCNAVDSTFIVFYEMPVAYIQNDTSICEQSISINGNWSIPNATGQWTVLTTPLNGNASFGMSNNPLTIINTYPNGTYSFEWAEMNGSNMSCIDKDTIIITFNNSPIAEAGLQQYVCGTFAQLLADTVGSNIDTAWWSNDFPGLNVTYTGTDVLPWNPLVDVSGISNFFVNGQRIVKFYWHAQNSFGCSAIDSVMIIFNEQPNANAGNDTLLCGLTNNLLGSWSISGAEGIWSLDVSGSSGLVNFYQNNVPNAMVMATLPGVYNFIWTEKNSSNNTCTSSDTVLVTFLAPPTPSVEADFSVCGDFANIHANTTLSGGYWSGPAGINFYDALNGALNLSYKDSLTSYIQWNIPNDTVTMYWIDNNGVCSGSDSVKIYFASLQTATTLVNSADSVVCGSQYSLLNAQSPAFGSGYWFDPTYSSIFSPDAQENAPIVTINTNGWGTYGYHSYYWVTLNGECKDTSNAVLVHFIEKPSLATLTNPNGNYWPGLFGANSKIKTDTVCGLKVGILPYAYGTWSAVSPDTYLSGNPTDTITVDSVTVFGTPDYRDFIWTADYMGCSNIDTLRLYFAPIPSGNFVSIAPQCPNNIGSCWQFVANTSQIFGSDYRLNNFNWLIGSGIYCDSLASTNNDTLNIWWNYGDQHDVNLITKSEYGCTSYLSRQLINEPFAGQLKGQLTSSLVVDFSTYELFVYNTIPNSQSVLRKKIQVDANGNFVSDIQNTGDYFLKARSVLNQSSISLTNSYYQNVWEWTNAQTLNFSCEDTNNISLQMLGYTAISGGDGVLSGKLVYDITSEPLADADIYLQNELTDEPVMLVKTNSLGDYVITGITEGQYKLKCEVPGLPQVTTHHFNITNDKFNYIYVNFVADSSFSNGSYGFGIYADTSSTINVPKVDILEGTINVYPSPFKENINITFNNLIKGNCSLFIMDNIGNEVYSKRCVLSNGRENTVNISTAFLNSGIYYVKIISDNGVFVKKVVKN